MFIVTKCKNILNILSSLCYSHAYICLLSVFILLRFACCLYLAFSSVCNYRHVFLCFSHYTVVCINIMYVLDMGRVAQSV